MNDLYTQIANVIVNAADAYIDGLRRDAAPDDDNQHDLIRKVARTAFLHGFHEGMSLAGSLTEATRQDPANRATSATPMKEQADARN